MRDNVPLLASYHMQALQFALIGQRVVVGHLSEKYLLHIVLWGSRGGAASAVVLVVLLLVVFDYLWQPETLAKEVDERLAEVLLRPVAVQEMSFIGINLQINNALTHESYSG